MQNIEFVAIVYGRQKLLENHGSFFFAQKLFFHNIVKKFAALDILHYQIKLLRSFNNFKKLDYVLMAHLFQNLNLSSQPLDVVILNYLALIKNLYSNLCKCLELD